MTATGEHVNCVPCRCEEDCGLWTFPDDEEMSPTLGKPVHDHRPELDEPIRETSIETIGATG